MRKPSLILALLILMTLIFGSTAYALEGSGGIRFNETPLDFTTLPVIYEKGALIVPLSDLSKALDCKVTWDASTKSLLAVKGNTSAFIRMEGEWVSIDGRQIKFHTDKMAAKKITTAPIRLTALVSAGKVSYDKNKKLLAVKEGVSDKGMENLLLVTELRLNRTAVGSWVDWTDSAVANGLLSAKVIDSRMSNHLILVNKFDNFLDKQYVPPHLTSVSKVPAILQKKGFQLNNEALKHLTLMLSAANKENVKNFVITSTYRTYAYQGYLYRQKVEYYKKRIKNGNAEAEAAKVAAPPGASEHQTGLAVDICSRDTALIERFKYTVQSKWLTKNSYKYGYIIRYPEGKTAVTGIIYEPWHLRYVGMPHSQIVTEKQICFEEYVEYLKKNRFVHYKAVDNGEYLIVYVPKGDLYKNQFVASSSKVYELTISPADKEGYIATVKISKPMSKTAQPNSVKK